MEPHSYHDMATFEFGNWWYVSRRRLLQRLLKKYGAPRGVALDLGCGVGAHFTLLTSYAEKCVGLDISADALHYAKRYPYTKLIESSIERIPLPDESVSIVLCTDVLEHVDDARALQEIYRVLQPDGMLYVTVPIFQSLWNENDDYSHHFRRYERGELRERVARCGLRVLHIHFWNMTSFLPTWIVARMYRKRDGVLKNNLSRVPTALNGALALALRIEDAIGALIPLPVGVSQVLVAEKTRIPQFEHEK